MGYHLTIIREKSATAPSITREEYVEACRLQNGLVMGDDSSTACMFAGGDLIATIKYQNGRVWTNVAEPEVIALMIELAEKLQARVRGSEGESYRSINETYTHPDDEESTSSELSNLKRARHKQAFWNIVQILAILLAIILIIANILQK